ncbi:MAG TPA: 23S rRNA (adenine(2030)-N(6))-methyltransferase RlmJ, partial [Kiloniellaceae bacterium]
RRQDRLVALELHPEDAAALAALFERDPQVKVQQADGYGGLKALLPPRERRGLVLIDPPFEERDEFERLVQGLRQAYRRWASGHYVIWYPIKGRPPVAAFHDALKATGIERILTVELLLRAPDDPERLNGCGLVLVNPPWPIEDKLRKLMPVLGDVLGAQPDSGSGVEWLVPELPPPVTPDKRA